MFQKRPGKTKASQKAEMEANKKKNAKKENIFTNSLAFFLNL